MGKWISKLLYAQNRIKKTLHGKLEDEDAEDNLYVLIFFLSDLPTLFTSSPAIKKIVNAMHNVITAGSTTMGNRIYNFLRTCTPEWKKEILEQFKDLTDSSNPEFYLDDGTPFLGNVPDTSEDAGDIPF